MNSIYPLWELKQQTKTVPGRIICVAQLIDGPNILHFLDTDGWLVLWSRLNHRRWYMGKLCNITSAA
jgi:hypothetical protein